MRHLAVGQLWVQERLREKSLTLYKVGGPANPADLLTKYLASAAIGTHLRVLHVGPEEGRPGSAPQVSAEIQPWLTAPGEA